MALSFLPINKSRQKEYNRKFRKYLIRRKRRQQNFFQATNVSYADLLDKSKKFFQSPNSSNLVVLLRMMTTSGVWISHSYLRFLVSMLEFSPQKHDLKTETGDTQDIIQAIIKGKEIPTTRATHSDIFKAIYSELEYAHHNPDYSSPLKCPKIKPTIVLISGVLNEIFSTAAFERGAKHLSELYNLEYIIAGVSGIKGSTDNAKQIKKDLLKYIKNNPGKKLWLVCYSKGGVDALHFLKSNKEFSEANITGISTIAAPILGSSHVNHKLIKLANSIHRYSDSKIYKMFDKKWDIFFKEFQKTLSESYQKPWFKSNYDKLPQKLFYTATALEAEWYESHIWMMLTKIFFQSKSINDGVVDAENALFPAYFDGMNLGIIRGHHLVGTRSSTYSQEALLESHIIFLKHLNYLT
ncbi:MAG: hypothetical protein HN509_10610 [Halobacteriovoraceae bacterium]|nr:hypothetical protein [Halobacteriovoraceae bacterium]MBT5095574.1 hypothetical protein [Halobacteriovoraceae bacterium]